jgi:hypothetical protein
MLRPAVKRNDGIELLKMRVPAGSIREKEFSTASMTYIMTRDHKGLSKTCQCPQSERKNIWEDKENRLATDVEQDSCR